MAIRLRYKWSLAVSSSDSEENDLGNVKYEVVSDANNEGGIWKTTVAGGATVPLNLDNIASAKLVMMRFTPKDPTLVMTPIVVTLNGTIVLPPITKVGDMDEALLVLTTQGITSVQVANTDVAAVAIDIAVAAAGD